MKIDSTCRNALLFGREAPMANILRLAQAQPMFCDNFSFLCFPAIIFWIVQISFPRLFTSLIIIIRRNFELSLSKSYDSFRAVFELSLSKSYDSFRNMVKYNLFQTVQTLKLWVKYYISVCESRPAVELNQSPRGGLYESTPWLKPQDTLQFFVQSKTPIHAAKHLIGFRQQLHEKLHSVLWTLTATRDNFFYCIFLLYFLFYFFILLLFLLYPYETELSKETKKWKIFPLFLFH